MPDFLHIALHNNTGSHQVYAYITGLAIQYGGQRCLLKADGQSLYFPQNPPKILSPLVEDCAIPLGPPGNTVMTRIPQLAGGRVWIARDAKLTFLLNPGPALVEPSVLNPTDLNINVDFGFCEFTLNDAQLYANISYVDFAPRLPIGIHLQTNSGPEQHVAGMGADSLDRLAEGLRRQAGKDNKPWDKLVVERNGQVLRILNATHGNAVRASFDGYYEPYVEDVWRYWLTQQTRGHVLKIDTQAGPGVLGSRFTNDGGLQIGNEMFGKRARLIFSAATADPSLRGPPQLRNAIIPRLAAAFVRSALMETDKHPSYPETFYKTDPTNHYARLVHEQTIDGKGYAFAYDDVQPDDGNDQSGKVNAGDPILFTVVVGGPQTM